MITYDSPVSAASGEIWDIDAHAAGNEQWDVEALGSEQHVIETITSPVFKGHGSDSLDGKPWVFSFDRDSADIQAIRLNFVGTKPNVLGVAFNNFSPTSPASVIPEPSSLTLLVYGLIALCVYGCFARRRRIGRCETG